MLDVSSWDRNPPNFMLDIVSYHSAIQATYFSLGIIMYYVLAFICLHFASSIEELCIMRVATVNSFARVLNIYIESDVNIFIGKALTDINRIMTIRKSDFSDKTRILPSCNLVSIIIRLHHLNFDEPPGEKDRWESHKDAACCFEPT